MKRVVVITDGGRISTFDDASLEITEAGEVRIHKTRRLPSGETAKYLAGQFMPGAWINAEETETFR